eukprot:GILI01003616.1.p1 GENE.GILI01003616.1~~GILI01003616.1.p1  ORF type:complete len:101 (+),score=27.70 GILI01003616.1:165-467(+)
MERSNKNQLPKQATDVLKIWFMDHVSHPYPSGKEITQLMKATGLSMKQIKTWFINARKRVLQPVKNSPGGSFPSASSPDSASAPSASSSLSVPYVQNNPC